MLLAAIITVLVTNAQTCSYTIYGHVEDMDTREKLEGATVFLTEKNKFVVTDSKGNFVFDSLCSGNYNLTISHISCDTVYKKIVLKNSIHLDIEMPHFTNVNLQQVEVIAQKQSISAGYKQELKGREFDAAKGESLAGALSKINGVSILQTGSTIAKPVIHGLHSNRLLMINNGVRQEGQQWGNEHAPEIDPFIADNLVVIKGVDELKYGSDAIGGVVLVNTKPLRSTVGTGTEIYAGYFANNKQFVASAMFENRLKHLPPLAFRLQGTYKRAANVATPDYRLNNTGLQEYNYSITTDWKKQAYHIGLFYSEFNTKAGIFTGAHIGNLTDLINAINADKPSNVYLSDNTYKIGRPYQQVLHRLLKANTLIHTNAGTINMQAALQYNYRKEYDVIRNNSINTAPQLNLEIITGTEDISYTHPKVKNFTGTIGFSAMQQQNRYKGRYFIPNYNAIMYGGYAIEKWIKHKWELQGGVRFDSKSIDTRRVRSNGVFNDNKFDFTTFASSFNAIYNVSSLFNMNFSASLSQRAPYVNELLSDGIHDGTGTYEQGDINLKKEQGIYLTLHAGWQNKAKTLSFDANIYNNSIRNFIYQQPVPDEPVLTIAGAFPKVKFMQTDANLAGADVSASYKFTQAFEFTTKASWLHARNTNENDWLISMPADRYAQELTYNFLKLKKLKQTYISIEVPTVVRQTRVPDETNGKMDYKEPPAGFTLVNMNASTTISLNKIPLTIAFGVRNLLDKSYRDYLNGFRYFNDEMGRNFNLKLNFKF